MVPPAMDNHPVVLIVDDEPTNLAVLGDILEDQGYEVIAAVSGEGALATAKQMQPDIVLLDINMPGWDGYETAEELRQCADIRPVPILFLSAQNDTQSKVKGFAVGAKDFITKPFQSEELLARLCTHLELDRLKTHLEMEVTKKTKELTESHGKLESAFKESLRLLSVAGEYRDIETGLHTRRIGEYARQTALLLGWDIQDAERLQIAAPLHDIGKIGIPDTVLLKKGRLTPDEWCIMRTHTQIGYAMLQSQSDSKMIKYSAEIALCHHEKYCGGGYPDGLQGEEIPISARIVAICDVYDALRSARPYKEGFSHEASVRIILEGDEIAKPEQFDPVILALFEKNSHVFERIFDEFQD